MSLTLAEVATGVTKKVRVALLDNCGTLRRQRSRARVVSRPRARPVGAPGRSATRSALGLRPVRQRPAVRNVRRRGTGDRESMRRVLGRRARPLGAGARGRGAPGVTSENFLTLARAGQRGPSVGTTWRLWSSYWRSKTTSASSARAPTCCTSCPSRSSQAALGADVEVPTIDGTARVTVPAGDPEWRSAQTAWARAARAQRHGPRRPARPGRSVDARRPVR